MLLSGPPTCWSCSAWFDFMLSVAVTDKLCGVHSDVTTCECT